MSLKPSLETLDFLEVDAIAIGVSEDMRPLSGVASFIDWRLCGRLTDLIIQGQFSGQTGETLLLATERRIQANRIFLFGWGPTQEFLVDYTNRIRWMVDVLAKAKVESCAFGLPDSCPKAIKETRNLATHKLPFQFIGVFDQDPLFQGAP